MHLWGILVQMLIGAIWGVDGLGALPLRFGGILAGLRL